MPATPFAAADYIETVVIDDTSADAGEWLICSVCEGSWRPASDESHASGCAVARVRELEADNAHLRECIRLDTSGLSAVLASIGRLVQGTSWLGEPGMWGSYPYEQHTLETLRAEISDVLSHIGQIVREASARSGTLVGYALMPGRSDLPVALTESQVEHLLWAWAEQTGLGGPARDEKWSAEHAAVMADIERRHAPFPGARFRCTSIPRLLAMLVALDVRRRGAADVWQAIAWLRSADAARAIRGLARGEDREHFLLGVLADALASAYAEQLCLPSTS